MSIFVRNDYDYIFLDINNTVINDNESTKIFDLIKKYFSKNYYSVFLNFTFVEKIENEFFERLFILYKDNKYKNLEISVFGLSNDLLMLFYLMNVDKYIQIYNDEADAILKTNMLVKRRLKIIRK